MDTKNKCGAYFAEMVRHPVLVPSRMRRRRDIPCGRLYRVTIRDNVIQLRHSTVREIEGSVDWAPTDVVAWSLAYGRLLRSASAGKQHQQQVVSKTSIASRTNFNVQLYRESRRPHVPRHRERRQSDERKVSKYRIIIMSTCASMANRASTRFFRKSDATARTVTDRGRVADDAASTAVAVREMPSL